MGSDPQPPQFITPPPPQITQTPAPNVGQNAEDLYAAQLKYNPLLTQQATQLQQQYGPQLTKTATDLQLQEAPRLAQSQFDIQNQFAPLYRQQYTNLFPTQVAGQEQLAKSSLQQLQSPYGLTPEQQAAQQTTRASAEGRVPDTFQAAMNQQALAQYQSPTGLTPQQQSAQDFVRNREQNRFQQGVRSQANLGGTLYSGNRQDQETQGLAELGRQYSLQDIGLQQQQRQEAQQNIMQAAQQEQAIAAQRQAFGLQDTGLQSQQLQQALQNLIASSQVAFPQVQQPGVQPGQAAQYGQPVTPSADSLLAAIQNGYIVQQPVYQPGNPGSPGYFQSTLRGLGGQPGSFY